MKVKLLHTITGLNIGGAEVMLARFLEKFEDERYASSVLSLLPFGALRTQIAETMADVYSIGMSRNPWPSDLYQLARLVGRVEPDIIHGWMYHGNLAATLGSIVGRAFAPIIWSVHHSVADLDNELPATRRLIRLCSRISPGTSAIVYCSSVAAAQHEALGFDPRRTVVIPNGIDCSQFRIDASASAKLKKRLVIPAERIIIGHVSRYHPMKDQTRLVQAIAQLVSGGYDVQGVFVGAGHSQGEVRKAAREFGIDERITTRETRRDIVDFIAGFDLCALSSAWGESFSLATAEAMSCGVPAVVTDVGDCPFLVGETGIVVPPRDTEALAAGLATLLDLGRDGRRRLGALARQRVKEHFSLARYVQRHLDLYQSIAVTNARLARRL